MKRRKKTSEEVKGVRESLLKWMMTNEKKNTIISIIVCNVCVYVYETWYNFEVQTLKKKKNIKYLKISSFYSARFLN